MVNNTTDLDKQTYVRLVTGTLAKMDKSAAAVGLRRASWTRAAVLEALTSSLPAMALEAAGGTRSDLLCLRLRSDDFKRLVAAAQKRGETTSDFLRTAIARKLGQVGR